MAFGLGDGSRMARWIPDSEDQFGLGHQLIVRVPHSLGVQWELPGAVARRDQSQALGFFLNPGR